MYSDGFGGFTFRVSIIRELEDRDLLPDGEKEQGELVVLIESIAEEILARLAVDYWAKKERSKNA